MKTAIAWEVAVIVIFVIAAVAGFYYLPRTPVGTSSPQTTSAVTNSGASVDGVEIVTNNITLSLGTGTWRIGLKNTGSWNVTSIVAYLETPTRATLCSGPQPSSGLYFRNCPPSGGSPLPPNATISGSSTGAGPASTVAGTRYPVAIHLAFANGQNAWLNSTVTSQSG